MAAEHGKGKIIGRFLQIIAAVALLTATMSAGGTRLRGKRFLPNEIIVKFRADPTALPDGQDAAERQKYLQAKALRLAQTHPGLQVQEVKPLLRRMPGSQSRWLRDRQNPPGDILGRILRRQKQGGQVSASSAPGRICRIRFEPADGLSLEDIVAAYQRDPEVEYAELNYVISVAATPNDSLYAEQWALPKISADQAWDTTAGSTEIVLAILDTGVDYNHRDLRNNIWPNRAELEGTAGVDDDGNGYVDDVRGYNFVYNSLDPLDDQGHGTHCAGIAAAQGNNGLDIAGICWNVKIMALKVMGGNGEGTTADAAEAIYYAAENGADVISCSWGSAGESSVLKEALDYAYQQGVVLVAAAGNDNSDEPVYPAAYDYVIAVAATDEADQRWYISSYGNWVDIAAPGADILSLRAQGTSQGKVRDAYTTVLSGTSMATPCVAGACAMLLSADPWLSSQEISQILVQTGSEIEKGICASNRRIRVDTALRRVIPSLGDLRLDKPAYRLHGRVGILLADWDLRGQGPPWVRLTTRQGDLETVSLAPSEAAVGVFLGSIETEVAPPILENGVIQVMDGDVIGVDYWDEDDGTAHKARRTAQARADYIPPSVVELKITTRGPVADVTVTTDEITALQLHYGRSPGGPYPVIVPHLEMGGSHSVRLQPLELDAEYYFVLELTDMAGNTGIADSNGQAYAFKTPADFAGFRVPSVYATIQQAVDDASNGDTIWVAEGTYSGLGNIGIDFGGKAIVLRSDNGPGRCIIDCRGEDRAFYFGKGEDANSVVDGFTIVSGAAGGSGGGIKCVASSPTIINCVFEYCSATEMGGGLYNVYGSSPIVRNCTFKDNAVGTSMFAGSGAGMCNRSDSNPRVENCRFIDNIAVYGGGGMANLDNSRPIITDCLFQGNSAGFRGGGMGNWRGSNATIRGCRFVSNWAEDNGGGLADYDSSSPTVTNCLFSANVADGYGGAIESNGSDLDMVNCTLVANESRWSCGGIWMGAGGTLRLLNCILWDNRQVNGSPEAAEITLGGGPAEVSYCCIQDWTGDLGGLGNIRLDPLFVDPNNGDFHLKSEGWRWDETRRRWDYDDQTSPCIDAGHPGMTLGAEPMVVPGDPNNLWGINRRIDMGAFGGTAEASMPPLDWALLADLDNNGIVNERDFAVAAAQWGARTAICEADLTRDGRVDAADLALLANDWLKDVKPPRVQITEPISGTVLMSPATDTILIRADAYDVDGPVVRVEFYANNVMIGSDEDGSDGWQFQWQGFGGGAQALYAKAYGDNGVAAFSPVVRITIVTPR